jgi:hypothetical protein
MPSIVNSLPFGPYRRFHLTVTRHGETLRTTVSLEPLVADLLAVSLGETPRTRAAHTAVRAWLDKSLSGWLPFDPALPLSRQAAYLALRRVAEPRWITALDHFEVGDSLDK